MMPVKRLAFLLLLLANTLNSSFPVDFEGDDWEHPLDCIFDQVLPPSCCWQPTNGSLTRANIHAQANQRWYQKQFRAVGLLPPESGFVALTARGPEEGATIWESCDFCTSSGQIDLTIRHWQSATVQLEICWRPSEEQNWQEMEEGGACMLMDPRTQFSIDPMALRVPSNLDIRLYFQLKNRSQMRTAIATVLIDYIHVQSEFCTTEEEAEGETEEANGKEEKEQKEKTKNSFHTEFELAGSEKKTDLITYEVEEKDHQSAHQQRAAPIKKMEGKEEEPMNAIFGEAFANFLLDPNFDTNKEEEEGRGEKATALVKKNIKKIGGANSLIKMHENIRRPCFTFGGCRFEHSSCGFSNSPLFSSNAQFLRKKIGPSYVVEAKISPGEVAVFESSTNMTDGDYIVLYNHFESATADSMQKPKFSACCYVHGREPIELECPFESDTFMPTKKGTTSEWKAGKIGCPMGTSKLMFTCEFYGTGSGICAIDGVRLHRKEDQNFREACQIREDE